MKRKERKREKEEGLKMKEREGGEIQRETQTHSDRQTDTQTDRQTDRQTDKQRQRENEYTIHIILRKILSLQLWHCDSDYGVLVAYLPRSSRSRPSISLNVLVISEVKHRLTDESDTILIYSSLHGHCWGPPSPDPSKCIDLCL